MPSKSSLPLLEAGDVAMAGLRVRDFQIGCCVGRPNRGAGIALYSCTDKVMAQDASRLATTQDRCLGSRWQAARPQGSARLIVFNPKDEPP